MVSVNKSAITPKKISLPENGKTTKPASLKSDAKISKAIVSQSTSTAGSELDFLQSFNSKLGNTKTSESTTKNIKAETTTTGEWNQEEAENLLKTGGSSSNPFAKGNMKPGFTGDDTAQSVLSRLNQKNGIDPTKSSTDSSTQNTQSDNFTKSMGVKQGNSTGVDFSKASTSEINDYLDNIQDGDLIDYDDAVSILGNGKLTKTELTKMKDQLETAYKSSG